MSVRERPILFNDAMVRAILDGRKVQMRRPIKPQPLPDAWWTGHIDVQCPYGQPGDRLWVRETWGLVLPHTDWETGIIDDVTDWEKPIPESRPHRSWHIWYRADNRNWDPTVEERGFRWRPSIHMPRWASRITLEITDVRVERVQNVTDEDIRAEGTDEWVKAGGVVCAPRDGFDGQSADESGRIAAKPSRVAFASMWNEAYAKRGLDWYANPWVWVVEFRRVEAAQ